MVFYAMLTGRQRGQKLQCLYGNPKSNNFFQIEFYTICKFAKFEGCNLVKRRSVNFVIVLYNYHRKEDNQSII